MDPQHRLRKPAQFATVYKSGRVAGNSMLVVRSRPNGTDITRVGFVAGKAFGNAVKRNRMKRRLRALATSLLTQPRLQPPASGPQPQSPSRAAPPPATTGFDIVVGVRRPAAAATHEELYRALASLLKRVT